MQDYELVLSDVHLGGQMRPGDDHDAIHYRYSAGEMQLTVATSNFPFRWPRSTLDDQAADTVNGEEEEAKLDQDGDMAVKRRSKQAPFDLIIEHSMASPLPLVGLQVWAGALLMCDYVLHERHRMSGKVVLELGAGTGICSVVASIFANKVYCTDYDSRVLRLCRRNVRRNAHLMQRCSSLFLPRSEPECAHVEVKQLDWQQTDPFQYAGLHESTEKAEEQEFGGLAEADRKDIEIIMAADVIYDNRLTDCLFRLLKRLAEEPPKKKIFISLERRLNFTLEKLDISCPAHDHFLRHLADPSFGDGRARQIPTDFPQYFDYERNKYLELWEISS